MIRKVISGGQTGADQAGLKAAARLGIETGGWIPKHFNTEKGPMPWLGQLYGLKEHASPEYPPRTAQNVKESDLTLIISESLDRGSQLTLNLCFKMNKPVFHINPKDFLIQGSLQVITDWILAKPHATINIAGNRESKSPGLERSAKEFLVKLFKRINA